MISLSLINEYRASFQIIPPKIERKGYEKMQLQKITSLFEALELLSEPPKGVMSKNLVTMNHFNRYFK